MLSKHIQAFLFLYCTFVAMTNEQITKTSNLPKDENVTIEKPKDCADLDKRRCKSGIYTFMLMDRIRLTYTAIWDIRGRVGRLFNVDLMERLISTGLGMNTAGVLGIWMENIGWASNDKIHILTFHGKYELRIELEDFGQEKRYALYRRFSVGNAESKYKLEVDGYSGNAGGSLTGQNIYKFSTNDQDNDISAESCARLYKGACWYSNCHGSNLNGAYLGGVTKSYADGVVWTAWKGFNYSLKSTTMMIRKTY